MSKEGGNSLESMSVYRTEPAHRKKVLYFGDMLSVGPV